MFHFPSTLSLQGFNGIRRSDGNLNATQQKHATQPIFLEIEEELHDARRVQSDGQEDDLRCALNMVIKRVTQLSSILSETYKTQADLEVQLNVAKSNLKLVIANNEMLEEALRQNFSSQSKDIGWNRTNPRNQPESPKSIPERSQSLDIPITEPQTTPLADTISSSSTANFSNPFQDNGFFGFRFSASYPTKSLTRPGTPSGQNSNSPQLPHLTSPSLPSLTSVKPKEIESLTAELEKEKAGRKKILEEKAAIEGELESLSQALFEEANKMVSDERQMRAEIEEELKELRKEKEALQSAMRVIEGENSNLRSVNASTASPLNIQPTQIVGEESLSQSLFEEANKMVSDERQMRAEIEMELKELRKEKEVLQSARRVIEGENSNLRSVNASTASPLNIQPVQNVFPSHEFSHSRSSSREAIKSRPHSLELASNYPLPPSPAPDTTGFSPWYEGLAQEENADMGMVTVLSPEGESQETPRLRIGVPGPIDNLFVEASPWADVLSKSALSS